MKSNKLKLDRPGRFVEAREFHYRVAVIDGALAKTAWEGESLLEGRQVFQELAAKYRGAGSSASVVMDAFTVETTRTWALRMHSSRPQVVRPPSATHLPGAKNRPKILFLPLEFPTWEEARGWTHGAGLAYAEALHRRGCDVTVVNSITTNHLRHFKWQEFDQVWFHVHFRVMRDHLFREWVGELAPVRVAMAGETLHYDEKEFELQPWFRAHGQAWEAWKPWVTHALFIDPADAQKIAGEGRIVSQHWEQAVPERMVREVRPAQTPEALFVGSPYPPRDRWLYDPALAGLLRRAQSPEAGTRFPAAWNRAHRWWGWWLGDGFAPHLSMRLYNAHVARLRRGTLRRFIDAIGRGSCVVNLPSMVKTYGGRVVEGMASGRPVLSHRPPHDAGTYSNGHEIVHYDDSPEALAEAIRELQRDEAKARRIAENARRLVLEKHTVEARTAQILSWVG